MTDSKSWTRGRLSDDERNHLTPILIETAHSVFSGMNQTIRGIDCVPAKVVRWSYPGALIGFAGKQAIGFLGLGTPWSFLRETHVGAASATDDDLLDWSREIANLTLGALKLALLRRGVLIEIGLPSTVLGEALEVQSSSGSGLAMSIELATGTTVQVLFDGAFAPDVVWASEPEPPIRGSGDGLF